MSTNDKPRVAILGAGVAGLSIAWRLAQMGARVDLIDKWHAGRAASWAAAGMLAPGIEFAREDEPLFMLGRESRRAWPSFAQEIEEEGHGPIGFVPSGSLVLSWSEEEASALKSRCREGGTAAEWLSPSGVRDLEPGLNGGLAGAAFLPGDAHVNNRWLLDRLVTACVHRNVRFYEGIEDAGLAFSHDRLVGIKGDNLSLSADVVVIAAGAWSSLVNGVPYEARIPIRPVKGQMIAVRPAETSLRHLIWNGDAYLVPRTGLPLAIGATSEEAGFDTTTTEEGKRDLLAAGRRAAPRVVAEEIVEAWAGLRPATPDKLPVLGCSSVPNLVYAGGQFRNGILFAPIIAKVVADLILSGEPALSIAAFSPLRFAPR